MWIDIHKKDWDRVRGIIQYVLDREGSVIDACMVQYIREELLAVEAHMHNEQSGVPGGKATGIAQQIGALLPFISSVSGSSQDE